MYRVEIAASSPPRTEADFRAAFYVSERSRGKRMVKEEFVTCEEFALVFWRVRGLRPGRSSIIDSQDLRAVEERDKMMKTLRYYLTHCFTHVTWGTQKSLGG